MKIYNYEKRCELRDSSIFRQTNAAFNYHGDNSPRNCGYLMKLIKDLNPCSPDDFVRKYLQWRKYNINERYVLANNLEDFMDQTGLGYELSVNLLLIYLCDNTWRGYYNENKAIRGIYRFFMDNASDSSNWDIRHAKSEIDVGYAIDILIYHYGKLRCGIQLKPQSFFDKGRKTYNEDIQRNVSKIRSFEKDYNVEAGFWTYEEIEAEKHARRV